jgi:hypothetical protein
MMLNGLQRGMAVLKKSGSTRSFQDSHWPAASTVPRHPESGFLFHGYSRPRHPVGFGDRWLLSSRCYRWPCVTVGSLTTRSLLDSVALTVPFKWPNEPDFPSRRHDQSNPNSRPPFLRDEAKFRKTVLPNEPNFGRFKRIDERIGSKRNGDRVETRDSGNALGFAGLAFGTRRGESNPNIGAT